MQSCKEDIALHTIAKLRRLIAQDTPRTLQDDVYMTHVGLQLEPSATLVTAAASAVDLQGLA